MTKKDVSFPVTYHDFYKTNGSDVVVMPEGPSLTRQEFAEECDINSLMARYEGHDIGSIMRRDMEPQYADFTTIPTDLLSYMTFMREAETAFMTLPAMVRRQFDNSAAEFVEFASDRGNLAQMREWGLAPPEKPLQPSASGSGSPAASAPQGAPASSGEPSTHVAT